MLQDWIFRLSHDGRALIGLGLVAGLGFGLTPATIARLTAVFAGL